MRVKYEKRDLQEDLNGLKECHSKRRRGPKRKPFCAWADRIAEETGTLQHLEEKQSKKEASFFREDDQVKTQLDVIKDYVVTLRRQLEQVRGQHQNKMNSRTEDLNEEIEKLKLKKDEYKKSLLISKRIIKLLIYQTRQY